jgi:hypothetical protein
VHLLKKRMMIDAEEFQHNPAVVREEGSCYYLRDRRKGICLSARNDFVFSTS